jgi:PHP family Zn ribbon phosphoesterase
VLKRLVADLHLHTVLSPCAEYRMVPELIVERALGAGLDMIAITDHNSGENAGAVVSAAANRPVAVLPGMEVESREGVHVLTIFDTIGDMEKWQERVYRGLPDRENEEKVFGAQLVVDAEGNLRSVNRRLLITDADLSLEEIVSGVRDCNGICIPAHIDRPSSGLLGVLGIVPEGLDVPAMEVSPNTTPAEVIRQHPELAGRTLLRSSDAHILEDIARVSTSFLVFEASVVEIARACRGELGRMIVPQF